MRTCYCLPAIAAAVLLCVSALSLHAEDVDVWRTPFGCGPKPVVNTADGSVWLGVGASVMHLSLDGSILSQTDGFSWPRSVSANPLNGSCWVADSDAELVHLSETGQEIDRIPDPSSPVSVSVNTDGGACWVGYHSASAPDAGEVVHLTDDGTELCRVPGFSSPQSVSADPTDGTCWVGDYDYEGSEVVRLAADGMELARYAGFSDSPSVSAVNGFCWVGDAGNDRVVRLPDGMVVTGFTRPGGVWADASDGSCWVADRGHGQIVHLSAAGTELWRGGEFFGAPRGVSVYPGDGSWWAGDYYQVVHGSASGSELWRGYMFSEPWSVSVNATDGSCWVADEEIEQVIHISAGGAELWRGENFDGPLCCSVNETDGSCWVADTGSDQVVHLSAAGAELWRGGGFQGPACVAANHSDGSCWVGDTGSCEVVLLTGNGVELVRVGGFTWPSFPYSFHEFLSVDPVDGSCWVADGTRVVRVATDGSIAREISGFSDAVSVSVNASDRSCWVGDSGILFDGTDAYLAHLAEDGTELWRGSLALTPMFVSANEADGSCWVGSANAVAHISAEGDELWRGHGFYNMQGLSVNPTDGSCWVADAFHGQVARLIPLCSQFSDVDCGHWALDQVNACVEAGIVAGYDDGLYHPEIAVTRDQMAVYIARALVVPSGEAALADYVPADPRNFPDVPDTRWGWKHIEYCVENAVVTGYEDGLYHPEYEVSRDQMAVYVARAMVAPTGEAALADYVPADPRNFPDVPDTRWGWKHIEYCVEHGVVQGYEDGYYHPEIAVSRDQMAVYVARAFGLAM